MALLTLAEAEKHPTWAHYRMHGTQVYGTAPSIDRPQTLLLILWDPQTLEQDAQFTDIAITMEKSPEHHSTSIARVDQHEDSGPTTTQPSRDVRLEPLTPNTETFELHRPDTASTRSGTNPASSRLADGLSLQASQSERKSNSIGSARSVKWLGFEDDSGNTESEKPTFLYFVGYKEFLYNSKSYSMRYFDKVHVERDGDGDNMEIVLKNEDAG